MGKTIRGTELGCLFVYRKQGLFLSVYVDDVQNPTWKKLMKLVDLGEPTSFLDHVSWDALNMNANRTKVFLTNTEKTKRESLQEQLKNYLYR